MTVECRDARTILRLVLVPFLESETREEKLGGLRRLARYGVCLSDAGVSARAAAEGMARDVRSSKILRELERLVETEIEAHHRRGDAVSVAQGLHARALIRRRLNVCDDPLKLGEIARDCSAALQLLDPGKHPAFFHRLVRELCETIPVARCFEDELADALEHLTKLFDSSRPGRPAFNAPIEATWRRWLRALILMRFGSHRRASNMLELCRGDFVRHRLLPEYLTASLDLAECGFQEEPKKQSEELRLLSADMALRFRLCGASADDRRSRAMLLVWRDHILHDDLTYEVHLATRLSVGRWLRKDLAKRDVDPEYVGPSYVDARDS